MTPQSVEVQAAVGETFANLVASGPLLLALLACVIAGLVSFASPCVVPLVPGYLSYLAGVVGAEAPAVSVGRMRSVMTPYVGPASIAFTMRNVVAPVTSSPAQIACWTGAAPRHAGRQEKWRLTQPCGGMPSADSGSRAP